VKVSTRREPYLFDKDTKSRWLLTESGREYVEENLDGELKALRQATGSRPTISDFVMWATFHQSYSYEDFVEGLRPVQSEEDVAGVSYEIVPGVFRRLCSRAAQDANNKYILVLDEINRGNIAKVLGELITLLEDDKRSGQPNELSITLPYSGATFQVPDNLYIIGTMNTADRSLALIDVALRRRFAFIELMPKLSLLKGMTVESIEAVVSLEKLLGSLNRSIERHRDRDHQIGHSYFLRVGQAEAEDRVEMMQFVWNYQIIPLLEEYFYSQRDKLNDILAPLRMDEEGDSEIDQDDETVLEIGRLVGEDLIVALVKLSQRSEGSEN
jgi:5-methylcytosine-specific restriction protein B